MTVLAIFAFGLLPEAYGSLCNEQLAPKEVAIEGIVRFLGLPKKPKPKHYKGRTIINWSEPAATSVFGRPKIVSYAYFENSQPFGISIANSDLVYIQTLDQNSKPTVVGLIIDAHTTIEDFEQNQNSIKIKATRVTENVTTRMKVTLTKSNKGEISIHSVVRITVDGVEAKPRNLEVTLTRTLPTQN